ncbi:MAG TPA: AAA family ATPase, partial [Nonomuraea sp.]|nr:AAA family ATPase [Nonomuraea sp.]
MHLVDRETQLDVLGEMLAACERSQGGAAFLHGAVASGKTVFVDAFVERAKSRAEVLCAVASRSEREIQFGVVSQLTDHPGLPAEDVAEVIGIIDEASRLDIPATADPDKIHPKLARSLARLSTALMRLAGDRPLVIVVDDLHHADKLSLDFLQYLTRRILNKRVLVVLTLVPGALPMHPLFWADILRQAGSRRINLPLLSRGAVFRLLTAQMGAHNAKRLAERCLELSGGNPLLVNALLKDGLGVWECPDKELTTTDASAYCEAVAACLRHSDPRVIEYAHGLAVLDVSNAADLIGPLLSLGDEAIRTLRCSLEGLGILTDSGFRHPVIRAAVLDEMRPERRADLHLQVAQLLYHEGAPVEDVANHLRWANRSATPWAVSVLQEAAEQALRADEVSRASEYLRLALRGAASEEKSAALTLVLARIDWRLNPSAVERHIAPLTESLLKGQLNVGQSVQLIRNLLHQGWLGEA